MWPRVDSVNKNPLRTLFKPLFFLQTLLGCARINLFGNSIQQLNIWQKIYGIAYMIFCILAYALYATENCGMIIQTDSIIEYVLSVAQLFAINLVNSVVILVNNLMYSEENLHLFTCLQFIDTKLKVIGKPEHYNSIFKFIIGAIIFNLMFHIYYIAMGVSMLPISNKWVPLVSHLMIVDDVEMIFFISLVLLMYKRVTYMNNILNEFSTTKWRHSTHINEPEVFRRMFEAFNGITKVIRCVEKTSRLYMLCFIFHFFTYHLFNVEISILYKMDNMYQQILERNWIVIKYISKITVLSLSVNYFEISLEYTKDRCFKVLRKNDNVVSRQYAKNIVRLLKHKLYPINVYRIVNLNAVLYELIYLTSQYSIVLLQFAYL